MEGFSGGVSSNSTKKNVHQDSLVGRNDGSEKSVLSVVSALVFSSLIGILVLF